MVGTGNTGKVVGILGLATGVAAALWFWLLLPFDNFNFCQNGGPFESMHFLNTVLTFARRYCSDELDTVTLDHER